MWVVVYADEYIETWVLCVVGQRCHKNQSFQSLQRTGLFSHVLIFQVIWLPLPSDWLSHHQQRGLRLCELWRYKDLQQVHEADQWFGCHVWSMWKIYTLSLNIWMSYKHLVSFIWRYRVYVYCGSPVLNMLCTHIGADAALSPVSSLRAEHSLEHMNCNFPPTIHLLYGEGLPWALEESFEGTGGLRLPHRTLESVIWYTNIQYVFSLDAQQIQSFALSLCNEVATFSRANPIENVLQSCLWLIFRAWRKIWNIACGPRRDPCVSRTPCEE